ncbi:TPA: hypothetical protein ACSK4F_002661 [Listeria monocytogenes]
MKKIKSLLSKMNKFALGISILIIIFVTLLATLLFIKPMITFLAVAGALLLWVGVLVSKKVYKEIDFFMWEAELEKYKEEE